MIGSMLKVAAKVGLASGAVYVSVNSGIWSRDTTHNAVAVKEFTQSVEGRLGVDYLSKMRSPSSESLVQIWNSGVSTAFNKAEEAPTYVSKQYASLKRKCSETFK